MIRWRRWLLLAIVLPLYALALMFLALAAATIIIDPIGGWRQCADTITDILFHGEWRYLADTMNDQLFLLYFTVPSLLVVATQTVFLLPMVAPPRVGTTGRSLLYSMLAAGLVGAGLATGLFLAVAEVINLMSSGSSGFITDSFASWCGWVMLPLAISWLGWSACVIIFTRRHHDPRVLNRLVGLLFAGTLVEVLVVVPLDIMVRRKTDCHCETGTAHTLGLSTWALLWLTGPGIVLAILSKRRRLWWNMQCPKCGYAKGPSPGARCPECGSDWATPRG